MRAVRAPAGVPALDELADGWADEFPTGEVRDFGWLGFRQNLGDHPATIRDTNFAMLEGLPDSSPVRLCSSLMVTVFMCLNVSQSKPGCQFRVG